MEEEELALSERTYRAKAGLIVALDFERFDALIRTIEKAGYKVVFRKLAPPWARLRVIEVEARHE